MGFSYLFGLIITGCDVPGEPDIAPDRADYQSFTFSTERTGTVNYYLNLQEREGMVAICGGVDELVRNNIIFLFFEGAEVRVRDSVIWEDIRFIINARFNERANCMLTSQEWGPAYQNATVSVQLPYSVSWTY